MTLQEFQAGNYTLSGAGAFSGEGLTLGIDNINLSCTGGTFKLVLNSSDISVTTPLTQATLTLSNGELTGVRLLLNCSCSYQSFTSFTGAFTL